MTNARKFLFLTLDRTPKGVAAFLERGPQIRRGVPGLASSSFSPGHSLEGTKSPNSGGR